MFIIVTLWLLSFLTTLDFFATVAIMASRRMSSEQIFSKLAPNKVIDNRFKISGGRLGVGNFGEVRLGIEMKTGKRCV